MKTILCYGDSNTHGYNPSTRSRYPKEERWPQILAAKLGSEYDVIAEGCNGRTTMFSKDGEETINGLLYLKPCLLSHKPVDTVILMLGTNDLKRVFGLNAVKIAEAAGILVQTIKDYTLQIQGFVPETILVSPARLGEGLATSPFYPEFDEISLAESREFSFEFRAVALEKGCRFFDAADIEVSPLDSLHLTKEGHRMLGEGLAEMF